MNTRTCPQCGAALPAGALEGLCPGCLLKEGAAADTATQGGGARFEPPGVQEVAGLFPQLEILSFIGKGGMGAVYKARQPSLDRLVALKILPPEAARGAGFAERFNREARALAKLNHPNIVAVYEFGQVNGMPFFLMEFVDGLNLRELERAGKLSAQEALQIVPQICEALQFAHDEGIVHRDIKPENILLDKKGRVKIADFGIAKLMGVGGGPLTPALSPGGGEGGTTKRHAVEADTPILTEAGKTMGTPNYMAPEQVRNPQEVDHRADIYSLGVVFYEMLTGELPLGKFAPPSRKVTVDVRLDEVVLRALEKEPERRYQQASDVKTMVETIATGTLGQTRKTPQNTEPLDARTWSPFQSPQLREICAHMTDEEKGDSARRGMFWGIWCAVSCFAFIFGVNFSRHVETALMLGVGFVIVQILAVTTWRRMQRQFLASTEWARQQGIEARTLPLFSFSLKGIALTGMRDGMREPNWIGIATAFVVVFAIMALVTVLVWLSARRDFHLVATLGIAFGLSMAVVAGGVVRALGRGWKAAVLWVILIPFVIGAFIAIKALEAPRAVDAMLFVQSPAGQLEASGYTIGAMRVFGGDNYIYRFQIRNSEGKILRTTEVPIPFQNDKLRTDPNAAPGSIADYYFGGNGRIEWAPDGSAVTFSIRGVELAHLQVDRFAVPATGGASGTRASAETWSPPGGTGPTLSEKVKKAVGQFSAPPPAVKVDPSKILSEAKQLAAQGQYEEALQRHIWYHNHALEQDSAQAGVRLSYALSDWVELGRKYPKAMRALVEIRDQDTARFATNGGYFALFMDVNSLNKNLQDEPATARLFKQIDKQDPALARQCYPVVESLLVQQGEYELCGKYVGDPDAAFDRIKGNWDMLRNMVRAPAGFADNQLVTKVCQLIEILNHTGHEVEAGRIRERARAVVDDSRLRAGKEQQSGPMSAFGPPIERMIYSVATQKPIKGQDFDSGTEIEVPDDVAKSGEDKFFQWIAEHGIDMMAFGHKASWDLWTPLKLASLDSADWETADTAKVQAALDSGVLKLELAEKSTFSGFRIYSVKTNAAMPVCLAFQTQKGRLGVVEIAGFSESPPGVKIRYKFAQGKVANQTAVITSSSATKTVVFTQITNQVVGTNGSTRTVDVWTRTTVFPGEIFRARQMLPDGQMNDAKSSLFTSRALGERKTSSVFSWFFDEPFGDAEAAAAVAEITRNLAERPITLTAGKPLTIFTITNRFGGSLSGYIEFSRAEPNPPMAVTASDTRAKARMRLQQFGNAATYFSGAVPSGYRLEATANWEEVARASASTSVSGDRESFGAWYLPQDFTYADLESAGSQVKLLSQTAPVEIIYGDPRLLFAVTNKVGEVYKGFLELVGPPIPENK